MINLKKIDEQKIDTDDITYWEIDSYDTDDFYYDKTDSEYYEPYSFDEFDKNKFWNYDLYINKNRFEETNIFYTAIWKYYPSRFLKKLRQKNKDQHNLIIDFKNGKLVKEFSHIISRVLNDQYTKEELKDLILLPIVASSKDRTEKRFKRLLEEISDKIGIQNGYNFIKNTKVCNPKHLNQGSSHLISTITFDKQSLKGKKIILIDDILTKGTTLRGLATKLNNECKVKSIDALFLGKTKHIDLEI